MFSKSKQHSGSKTTSSQRGHGFGTAPVFLTSITTILGAILFLRFGYAVANVGLWGSLIIILYFLYQPRDFGRRGDAKIFSG